MILTSTEVSVLHSARLTAPTRAALSALQCVIVYHFVGHYTKGFTQTPPPAAQTSPWISQMPESCAVVCTGAAGYVWTDVKRLVWSIDWPVCVCACVLLAGGPAIDRGIMVSPGFKPLC